MLLLLLPLLLLAADDVGNVLLAAVDVGDVNSTSKFFLNVKTYSTLHRCRCAPVATPQWRYAALEAARDTRDHLTNCATEDPTTGNTNGCFSYLGYVGDRGDRVVVAQRRDAVRRDRHSAEIGDPRDERRHPAQSGRTTRTRRRGRGR